MSKHDSLSRNLPTGGPASPIRRTRSANDMNSLPRPNDATTASPSPALGSPAIIGADLNAALTSNTEGSNSKLNEGVGDGASGSTIIEPLPTRASRSASPQMPQLEALDSTTATASSAGMRPLPNQDSPQTSGNPTTPRDGPVRRFFSSVGLGRGATPAQKRRSTLVWNLVWGFVQVVVISILVALTGTVWKSPILPELTEWQACDRPLGVWAILWVVRVLLATGMVYWEYRRAQQTAAYRAANPPPPASDPPVVPSHPVDVFNAHPPGGRPAGEAPVPLSHTGLYTKFSTISSLFTLAWFITAHILQYTSTHTCRYTAPHLWWLTFAILCIMYLMILEVLLLGFIVLILAPILFIFWNVFLFCIGRHPAQNPHMIKPEIGKLSKSLVDRIPLVMYIPPPPGTENDSGTGAPSPPPSHAYPPTSPSQPQPPPGPAPTTSAATPPKRNRFRFFKRKATPKDLAAAAAAEGAAGEVDLEKGKVEQETWEGQYEKGDYPFVVLDGNRAACAICLCDFEAPPLRSEAATPSGSGTPAPRSTPVLDRSTSDNTLKLADAGEGAQPLRLLACGHVFHQTCLDPWLTDVSGRCPVCQRPVEVSELKKRPRRR